MQGSIMHRNKIASAQYKDIIYFPLWNRDIFKHSSRIIYPFWHSNGILRKASSGFEKLAGAFNVHN
jgi:hypothetical protein